MAIVGDTVRTPDGWFGIVTKFVGQRSPGKHRRVCWVRNGHGESFAIHEKDLTPVSAEQAPSPAVGNASKGDE